MSLEPYLLQLAAFYLLLRIDVTALYVQNKCRKDLIRFVKGNELVETSANCKLQMAKVKKKRTGTGK